MKGKIDVEEIWKPIPEFPGYEVSNRGQVRSYKTREGIASFPLRILKPSSDGNGYLGINLCKDGVRYRRRIASLVLLAFVGSRPDGLEVCHNDHNKANNHLGNLRYDTHKANTSEGPRSKGPRLLSRKEVLDIRVKRMNGARVKDLALQYGVSRRVISGICRGRTYRDIGGPISPSHLKLKAPDIKTIRKLWERGQTLPEIARKFGVTKYCISKIVNRARWAHVDT